MSGAIQVQPAGSTVVVAATTGGGAAAQLYFDSGCTKAANNPSITQPTNFYVVADGFYLISLKIAGNEQATPEGNPIGEQLNSQRIVVLTPVSPTASAAVESFNTRVGLVTLELADVLGTGLSAATLGADPAGSATNAEAAAVALSLQKAANLSDLANAGTARGNLGLGTAATQPSTAFDPAGQGDASAAAVLAGIQTEGVNSGSVITSGALPTITFASGVGKQVSATRDANLTVPVTFTSTVSVGASCLIELSPDGVTYSTLVTLASPIGLAFAGEIRDFSRMIRKGWFIRFTPANATVGTGTWD